MSDAATQATEIDGPRRALITVSVMLASVIQTLDNTIANVALPRIQGSLSATQDQMAWVLTSYIVAAAIMTPLSGWLAGQIGRKRVFLYSIAGFTLASMLCGLAQSLSQMVMARLLQGLCGAALVPLSQAVLLDINPPARHARAMSVWVMGVTLGPIIGPALGGWLTENYNWRWVFYINVPVGTLAFLGIASFLPKAAIRKSRFDFFGFTALSVGSRRSADPARSRSIEGLVQLNGNLDRNHHCGCGLLFIRHSYVDDDRAALRESVALQRS